MKSRIQRDPSIGVIGLGIMGSAIARHVIQAGYRVSGYDVRALRLRHLRAAGGTAAKSAGDVGKRSSLVITSLPSADALTAIADALAQVEDPPPFVIETSTLSIETKERARSITSARLVTARK
jgi:3-hydroxyisobutyrate dehydrogenase-like beta-hydroxyacid dehydrogenase